MNPCFSVRPLDERMAKSEEQKAARRERRAIARREAEERELEVQKKLRLEGPWGSVTCYRCHEKGHYAAMCKEKRKRIGEETKEKRSRPEIVCFKCREKGHFFHHCPKAKKKGSPPPAQNRGPNICFHCKQPRHTARRCNERQRGRQAVMRPARASSEKIVRKDGSILYVCKKCTYWGHVDAECPVVQKQPLEEFMSEESSLKKSGEENM